MTPELQIAIGGFTLALASQIIGGIWFIARMKAELGDEISKKCTDIDHRYNKECGDLHEKINIESRHGGEALSAIRQKIHEVEVWGRDNYAQKGELKESIDLVRETIRTLGDRMSASFDKLEARMERSHPH